MELLAPVVRVPLGSAFLSDAVSRTEPLVHEDVPIVACKMFVYCNISGFSVVIMILIL